MKNTGKPSKPIIAAHATKQQGKEPAPPANGNSPGSRTRVSRVPKRNTAKMKSLVLERINDGILGFDAQMNHVYVDERAGELLGRDPGELLGRNFREAYPDSESTPFGDACRRALETQTVVPFEGYFTSSNTWFEGRVYPSTDGLSVLISEHGHPEQDDMFRAIERSEEKFAKAFHSSPSAITIIRRRDGHIIDVNQSWLNMFGFERSQIIDRTITEIGIDISPAWLQTLNQLWQDQGHIQDLELEMQVSSGETRIVLLSIEVIDIDEEACLLISSLDITGRKKAEEKVREISEFPVQNPNPILRYARDGRLLFANPAATTLLDTWDRPSGHGLPGGVREILTALEPGSKKEIEINVNEKRYTCLFVAVPESDYVNLYFNDITGRKQVEEHLRELTQRLTYHVDNSPLAVIEWGPDMRLTRWSGASEQIFGWKAEEVLGKRIEDFRWVYEEDVREVNNVTDDLQTGTALKRFSANRNYRKDGSVAYCEWYNSSLLDGSGQLRSILSLVLDVTERKQAEKALHDSEERFAKAFHASPEAITISQLADGVILEVNNSWKDLFGYEASEACGRSSLDLNLFAQAGDRAKALELFKQNGFLRGYEIDIRRKSGEIRKATLSVEKIQINGVDCLLTISSDITERRQMEKQLEQSIRWFNQILDSIQDDFYVLDHDWRFVYASRLFTSKVGKVPEDFIGNKIWEMFPKHVGTHFEENLRTAMEKREVRRFEVGGKYTKAWYRLAVFPSAEGITVLGTDITELKQAEERNRLAAEFDAYRVKLADALRPLNDPAQILLQSMQILGEYLQVDRVLYTDIDESRQVAVVLDNYVREGISRLVGTFPLGGYDMAGGKLRAGEKLIVSDATTSPDLGEVERIKCASLGIRSSMGNPIIKNGVWVANLDVHHGTAREWTAQEIAILQETAERTWVVVERARTQEKLRESQQRLALTYHHTPIGIVETDSNGHFIDANDRFLKMLGYSHNELLALSITDITHEEDVKWEFELYKQLQKDEIPYYQLEKRFKRKDGSVVWGEVVRAIVHDAKEQPMYSIGAVLDITERKQREEMVRARTEEIETLMEMSPVAIFVAHDPQCIHITANPAGYGLMNMPEDSYRNISKSAPEPERPSYRVFRNGVELLTEQLPMQVAARLGMEIEEETLEIHFDDGSYKYIYSYAKPLFDADGRTRGAMAAMMDITEIKRSEEALRRSEERFALFMQHLPGLAWIKDLDGRYVFANSAASEAFNMPHEMLIGRTDWEIFPEDVAGTFRQNDEQALLDQKGIQIIETLEQPDGILHHSLVGKFPIPGPDGKPALIGGTAFDITERVQMEEALRSERNRAEQTAKRVTRLQEVTAALSQTLSPAEIGKILVEKASPVLGADRTSFFLLDEDEQTLTSMYTNNLEGIKQQWGSIPLSLNVPASDAVLHRKPVWLASSQEYIQQYPHLEEKIREWGYEGALAIPMMYKGRVLGVLTMGFPDPLPHTAEDERYILTLAYQGAQALERSQAEQQLRLNATIMENAPAGVYLVRASDGTIIYSNPTFNNMFGYEPGEIVGKHVSIINAPGDRSPQDVAQDIIEILRSKGAWQGEVFSMQKDGTPFWCYGSVTTFEHATHGTVWVAARQDITERKQAESRLALLVEVSELTRKFEEPVALMKAVSHVLGRYLNAKRCLFTEIDLESDVALFHPDYNNNIDSLEGLHRSTEFSRSTTSELAEGKTVVNVDSMTDPRTADDYERSYKPMGIRSYIAVPMLRGWRFIAALLVADDEPRTWTHNEIALIEAVAERTWTVTEKLRIHAALRDSEERLRVTFNTTAVGFATLAPDTRFVDVNQAFCEMVGYLREELLDMACATLSRDDYIEDTKKHIAQLIAGELPSFILETIFIRKDGTEIWVQNSVSLVRDAEGNPQHLIAISQDITERKRTESALHQLNMELESRVERRTAELQSAYEFLRESEAVSRLILESMPDAIIVADKNGNIVYGNSQVETLFGYSPGELMGQPVETLIPERYHGAHEGHRTRFGRNPERRFMGLGMDLYGQRKDASEFPVDVMLSPISNSTTWDVMITIRDNTQQKQAQEAIRANEEKLRKLFEILPVGISFINDEGKITEMNSTLIQILGMSKLELAEGRFRTRRYIRSDGSVMPVSEFASARARSEQRPVYDVETGIVKENGDVIWTSVNAAPVDVADVDIVVATIDITERKKAEETLRKHRERLRVLSRRLVEVQEEERRAIAHELHDRVGQNLAALNLNLNILRNQISAGSLQAIGTRLDDSVSLVNQILNITRNVMSDLRSNVLDDYGLEAALREYADRFTQRTGIQVATSKIGNTFPRLDPAIEMTLLRIAQEALTNVSRHAQADVVNISMNADGQTIYMSIEDNGIGILSWQKANQPGSHGLRIIRERAEAFGGSLQVHSAYKKGTRIEVKIPVGSTGPLKVSREKQS